MLRLKATITPFGDLFDTLEQDYNRALQSARDTVSSVIEPQLKYDLSQQPGKPKYPLEWARSPKPPNRSPNMYDGTYSKQKAAFFATNGFGGGIPHRRTGAMSQGWDISTELLEQAIALQVGHESDRAKFVYGNLNQRNRNEAIRPQQQFHRDTGWLVAVDVIRPRVNQAGFIVQEEMTRELGQAVDVNIRRRSRQ